MSEKMSRRARMEEECAGVADGKLWNKIEREEK
jgi:hypothetical protein